MRERIDYLQKELKIIKYFVFLLFFCYGGLFMANLGVVNGLLDCMIWERLI